MRKLLCIFCLFALVLSTFSQERRLALDIGNSEYGQAGPLRSPANDAYAMRNVLRQSGFEVLDYYDLDYVQMIDAINDFGSRMETYDVGLFYYAGHGIQENGENYLIPVDADLTPGQLVEDICIRADRALSFMNASRSIVNIMILDACRNSPYERRWNQTSEGRGLAAMEAPRGSLIAFATHPGRTTSDGDVNTGIYTDAIVENMRIPNLHIEKLFKNVRSLVSIRSGDRQDPWETASLRDKFFLKESAGSYDPNYENPKLSTKEKKEFYSNSYARKENNSYRAGLILQSVAIPGLGLSRATGKPHWLRGVAGYGCVAGSLVLNRMAADSYSKFLDVYDPDEAVLLLDKSTRQDNLSELFAYTAMGIWAIDLVWTIIGSSDLTKEMSRNRKLGFSVGSGIDPAFRVSVVGLVYRF